MQYLTTMSCYLALASMPARSMAAFTPATRRKIATSRLLAVTTTDSTKPNNFLEGMKNMFSSMAAAGADAGKSSDVYTVAVTGSSGLVGRALLNEIQSKGMIKGKQVKVIKLIREGKGSADGDSSLAWNPDTDDMAIDPGLLADVDAVVHIAGENVSTGLGPLGFLGIRPWTDEKKSAILDSRVKSTKALAAAVREANKSPGSKIDFLCASGPGIYGYDGVGASAPLWDESADTSGTTGFLAEISREWEGAAMEKANGRVVLMRFGVVLSKMGGALAKLYPIFLVGGGGNVGSGNQFFPFISARDLARSIVHTIETPQLKGPVNMVAPTPCTNAEFTSSFGSLISRPTILPLPGFAVSALFGQMGEEMLLGGQKVSASKLVESGFEFQHDTIEKALKSAIDEENDI